MSESEVALGNGDGTFQPPQAFGYGQRSIGSDSINLIALRVNPPLVTADFNRDGRVDVAMPSHFTVLFDRSGYVSSGVSILLNNSPGTSTSATAVSAADGDRVVAPGSIAAIYGANLASTTASAQQPANLPTHLGGISLHIRDAFGADRLAPLLFVSQNRITFIVPDTTAEGLAAVNIDDGRFPSMEGLRATPVQLLAPAFFTADGSGTGAAAATAVRVLPDGTQVPVPVFSCTNGRCSTVPIDLTQGPVYLSLYGTGFRHRSANPYCSVLAAYATLLNVTYAGPQGEIPGLDQLNLLLPHISGAGEVDVVCSFSALADLAFEGAHTQPVKIRIQ